MGHIKTLKEMFRAKPQANSLVRMHLAEELEAAPFVLGALMYGSHDPKSDIDFLVVFEPGFEENAALLREQLDDFAQKSGVPLDGRWLSQLEAQSEECLLRAGLSYYLHLRRAARHGGTIKDNPVGFMPLYTGNWEERLAYELKLYLVDQLAVVKKWRSEFLHVIGEVLPERRTQNKLSDYDFELARIKCHKMGREDFYQFVEKVLSVPGHVMRKEVELRDIGLEDDSAKNVVIRYRRLVDTGTWDIVCRMQDAKQQLRNAEADRFKSHAEYSDYLIRIERTGSELLETFLESRLLHIE